MRYYDMDHLTREGFEDYVIGVMAEHERLVARLCKASQQYKASLNQA